MEDQDFLKAHLMIRMVMEIIRMPMTMSKTMVTMKKRPSWPTVLPPDVAKSQDP